MMYAEDIGNYWKTGSSAPETILSKAAKEVKKIGGKITTEAFIHQENRAVFVLEFEIGQQKYRAAYPVAECKKKSDENERAARRQAVTFLFYSVKAKCLDMKLLGAKVAFASWLLVDGRRSVSEIILTQDGDHLPKMLTGSTGEDVLEAEFK